MSNTKMVQKLTEIFKELDESGEGLLSKEELKKGYKKFFSDNLTDSEFDEIMKTIDQDKSGQISIEEFLRATVDYENLVSEKNLKYAFEYFDKDHSGFLSPDEIRDVLGLTEQNEETSKLVNEIIKEVDTNGDGQISYDEFKAMMKLNQGLITGKDNIDNDKKEN
jgi:calcium-dependent protein kinase